MIEYVSEHDEFLLSQFLDGELPQDEALALRLRIEKEPALRRALDQLRRINGLVQAKASDLPTVNYEAFHAQLMNKLTSTDVARASTTEVSEADEFLLNRFIDGDLIAEEESALGERLAREPVLQARLESFKSLDAALLGRRTALPAINYNRFHKQVMADIHAEAGRKRRFFQFPAWARIAAPLAAAAAIAMVVWLQPGSPRLDQPASIEPSNTEVAVIEPPAVDPAPEALASADDRDSVTIVKTSAAVPSDSGTIAVAVGKPADGDGQTDAIHVSFARSAEIAESVREGDQERSNRPSRKVFFVAANPTPPSNGMSGDLF